MSDDDKIKPIGIEFKEPPQVSPPTLKVVGGGCSHDYIFSGGKMVDVQYLIRPGEAEVECGHCGAKLDPMFVLRRLADRDSQIMRARAAYAEEMKRLSERRRTKCQHCGEMTRISNR